MRTQITAILVLSVSFCLAASAPLTHAALLSLDFQTTGNATETGFDAFTDDGGAPISKPYGLITVSVSGQQDFFNSGGLSDSGSLTYAELYRDFVHENSGGTISFTIDGLEPNTSYPITWYAYQSAPFIVETGFRAAALSDTTGSVGSITWDGSAPPTTNDQYSYTGVWSSTDGSLELEAYFISDNYGPGNLIRVSGFVLGEAIPAPEPSSLLLLGLGAIGLVRGARRRRRKA